MQMEIISALKQKVKAIAMEEQKRMNKNSDIYDKIPVKEKENMFFLNGWMEQNIFFKTVE
jgi:hypothetical protein